MSAITAKAINDTIGTPEFKGLNTIIDEHLNKFDEILQRNVDDIRDAVSSIEALTNPVYAYKEGDASIAKAELYVADDSPKMISQKIVLNYGGFARIEATPESNFIKYQGVLDSFYDVESESYIISFSEGAKIWLESPSGAESGLYVLRVYAHTEFAPSISVGFEN